MSTDDYKQPHEGVKGTDRGTDDLLSLDERATAHRDALIAVALHLDDACQVGNPAPKVQRMYERIRSPQLGDLVVESTRVPWTTNHIDRIKGFGYLVEHRREWWSTNDQWNRKLAEGEVDPDDTRPIDEAWYVQYGPNPADICRWTNAQVLVVPINPAEFRGPIHRDESGAVVITRDSLISTLADSGFTLRTDTGFTP